MGPLQQLHCNQHLMSTGGDSSCDATAALETLLGAAKPPRAAAPEDIYDSNDCSKHAVAVDYEVLPPSPLWAPNTPPRSPKSPHISSYVCSQSASSSSSRPDSPLQASTANSFTAAEQAPQRQEPGAAAAAAAGLLDVSSSATDAELREVFQGRKILIISGGTRGDVQPATALGVALSGLGALVCIAADCSFKGFVLQQGLGYSPLGGDAREMMALTVKWGGMLPTEMSGMWWLRGQIKEVMESVWQAAAAFQPDLMMANQLAYGQVHVAEKLGIPLHMIYTIPWLPTSSIAHPWARAYGSNIIDYLNGAAGALLAPGLRVLKLLSPSLNSKVEQAVMPRVAAAANWVTTPLLDHTTWWGIADLIAAFRYQLGLSMLSGNNSWGLYKLPTTCLFSSHLVPRPADWGPHVTLAGFVSLTDAVQRYSSSSSSSSLLSSDYSAATQDSSGTAGSGESSMSADLDVIISDDAGPLPLNLGGELQEPTAAADAPAAAAADVTDSWQPPQQLIRFLAAGPAPIYVGFGSVVWEDTQELIQLVVEAALQLPGSHRLIVCTGWSGLEAGPAAANDGSSCSNSSSSSSLLSSAVSSGGAEGGAPAAAASVFGKQQLLSGGSSSSSNNSSSTAPGSSNSSDETGEVDRVLYISEAPHDWLFPRCIAVIHHGGVGTTAVGLKCGKPTMIVPAFGDLFFWGDMCHQLGVGPAPLPLDRVCRASVAAAVEQLMGNSGYRAAAATVAVQLQNEEGVSCAVQSVARSLV